MGLLDSIIGSVVGGNASQQQGAGANPLIGILMSLLAAKAGGGTGGLGNILSNLSAGAGSSGPGGGLGGLLGGADEAGGLGALVEQFTRAGYGDTINSWIGPGQNRPVPPQDLGAAIGAEAVAELSHQTGMSGGDLLSQLSHLLPGVVDQLTPQGRMPTEQEQAHW